MSTEADTMFVQPAREGLRVIDPATRQPLPPEGARVSRTGYWIRRRQQGDVLELEQPTAPAAIEQPGEMPAAVPEEAPRRATRAK